MVLSTRNVVARYAAGILWHIATRLSELAVENVVVRCSSVESAGTAPVYCLTVPGLNAFVIESGLVVHNTRYLVRSGMKRAKVKPPDQPKTQTQELVYDMGTLGTGWMS